MSAWSIDKNKSVAACHLPAQFTRNNAAERIKTFAHIGFLAVQKIISQVRQMQDSTHPINSLRNEALTGW